MAKSKVVPVTAMLFLVFLWGVSFLSIKVTVDILGPMSLALGRFLIASVLLLAFLKIKEPSARLQKADLPMMALSGIVGITIYFFFENTGVKNTTASTASIIIATIPILTVAADYIFCGNKINLAKIVGIILSFLGVYLIVRDGGRFDFSSGTFVGDLFMLGAAASWVAYSLLTRPLSKRYSLLAVTTYQTLLGTLAIAPFALFEKVNWPMVSGVTVANVVFLGVFCSAIGYFLYVYAMDRLGVAVATLFINLIPLITVICSFFILKEKITPIQLIGGGMILAALYIADTDTWVKKVSKHGVQPPIK